MPLDSSFAQIFNVSPNLQQRRQDDMIALQLQQQQESEIKQKQQERLASLQTIGQYFGQVDQLTRNLLPNDRERAMAQLQPYKQKVIDNIKKFGNDPDNYLINGGIIEVQNFPNVFESLPAYQNGQMNKMNLASGLKDLADGKKQIRDVTYKLMDGTTKTAPWEQAIADFQNNLTDTLPYEGSFELPKFSPLEYAKIKSDYRQVGTDEHISNLIQAGGLNPQDAPQYLRTFGKMFLDPSDPSKTIYRYGGDNPDDVLYKKLRNLNLENRISAHDKDLINTWDAYAKYGGDPADPKTTIGYNAATSQIWKGVDANGKPANTNVRIETYYTDPKRVGAMASAIGLKPTRIATGADKGKLEWVNTWTAPHNVFLNDGTKMELGQQDIRDLQVDPSNIYVIRDEHGNAVQALLGHFFLSADATERNNLSYYRSHNYGGQRHGYGLFHGGSDVAAYIPLNANDLEQHIFDKANSLKGDITDWTDQNDNTDENAQQDAADYLATAPQ